MKLEQMESIYCSQGDVSGKHIPKKYFTKSEGLYLYDECENKYLDFQMHNSSANFGYQNPIHNNAISLQIANMPSLSSEFMHRNRVLLSKEICEDVYIKTKNRGRVHFSVGGAQAIDDAIKIIANSTGNRNFFAFEGSYHGRTIGASSISSSPRYRKYGNINKAQFIPFPYCFRCAYGKKRDDCDLFCIRQIRRLFENEYLGVYDTNTSTSEISAFFVESVLGRGGYVLPPQGYFNELAKVLKEYNRPVPKPVRCGIIIQGDNNKRI